MIRAEAISQNALNPAEEGWIPLGPVHLFPWILFLAALLESLVFAFLPYTIHVRIFVGGGFTLLRWVLGGLAIAVALRERSRKTPGSLRGMAFGLAAAALGLRICLSIALQFASRMGMSVYPIMMGSHWLTAAMGFGALLLLVIGREEDAGGRFDAAVAALAIVSGLEWLGLPVLAIAAIRGHSLLTAQWQALRDPKTALEGGWFDGLDDVLRMNNLGACALLCAVAFLALLGRFFTSFGHAGAFSSTLWWASADIVAAVLASLILALHVIRHSRRTGHPKGRGLAVAAILVVGLPLLLAFVDLVLLVLILTDVIHFRLF